MSIFTTEEWKEWKPIYEFIELLESKEMSLGFLGEELFVRGNLAALDEYREQINANAEKIIQVLKWRPFGPPLVQDPAIYKVPTYTDEQKDDMTEAYIRRLQVEEPLSDAPLVIVDGHIVHDFDEHDERTPRTTKAKEGFVVTGRCFYCFQPMGADQPGGQNPRHVADQVPYGQCEAARKEKERESNL